MPTWLEMLTDNAIGNDAVVTAPNGEKVTMGQVREAWLAREAEVARREKEIQVAQGELANVYQILQEEKVAVEGGREDIRRREAQLENLQNKENPTVAESKRMEALETEIANMKSAIEKQHKNSVEMADVWLDEKFDAVLSKYKSELPDGITRNALLQYANQNQIRDRRGILDLDAAAQRIIEPKRREAIIKEAEERGARRKEEELTMRSMGAPSSFGPRGSQAGQGAPEKFASIDAAFEAAAKDASIWMPGADRVQ